MRAILERIPADVNAQHRSVLLTLLSHLKTSGLPEDTPKRDIVVTGQASLVQLELAGYREASLKKKLNYLRRLGHVDWKYRDDNCGRDFFVYATARDEVKARAVVDPARSEQGRRAAARRKDRQTCTLSQNADGGHKWEPIDEDGTQQCFYCTELRRVRAPRQQTAGFEEEESSDVLGAQGFFVDEDENVTVTEPFDIDEDDLPPVSRAGARRLDDLGVRTAFCKPQLANTTSGKRKQRTKTGTEETTASGFIPECICTNPMRDRDDPTMCIECGNPIFAS